MSSAIQRGGKEQGSGALRARCAGSVPPFLCPWPELRPRHTSLQGGRVREWHTLAPSCGWHTPIVSICLILFLISAGCAPPHGVPDLHNLLLEKHWLKQEEKRTVLYIPGRPETGPSRAWLFKWLSGVIKDAGLSVFATSAHQQLSWRQGPSARWGLGCTARVLCM